MIYAVMKSSKIHQTSSIFDYINMYTMLQFIAALSSIFLYLPIYDWYYSPSSSAST